MRSQKYGVQRILTSKRKYPGANQIIARLQDGQKLLNQQHLAFMNEEPEAWETVRFGNALAHWENLERVLRCTPFKGCIWNPNTPACNQDSVVVCDACVRRGEDDR